nr:MAG TPA: hypothetical protein [Caudoviricetes sp.]
MQTLSSPPDGFHRRRPRHRPRTSSGLAFQQSKGRSESKDGTGSTPMPATQPHPLVRTGHTTATSKGNHTMDENKPQSAKWVLCVDIDPDNPESDPMFVAALDMPLDGGLISVTLPGNRLGEATALAARTACQVIDKALKRHLERSGGDAVEMLDGLRIDPMGDIRDGRP